MREILFRGKAEIGGNWVYGDLIHRLGGATIGTVDSNGLHELYVSEDTVGQYTGLTDKNGTKIFEGDIILYNNTNEYGCIEYDKDDGMFVAKFDTCCVNFGLEYSTSFEVIGNIHDNPELLEVE